MSAPLLPGFLTYFVYPALLTSFGIAGNSYLLGGQIKDHIKVLKDDLGGKVARMAVDVEKVAKQIEDLAARQRALEHHDMAVAEKMLRDCNKRK